MGITQHEVRLVFNEEFPTGGLLTCSDIADKLPGGRIKENVNAASTLLSHALKNSKAVKVVERTKPRVYEKLKDDRVKRVVKSRVNHLAEATPVRVSNPGSERRKDAFMEVCIMFEEFENRLRKLEGIVAAVVVKELRDGQ